MSKLQQLAASRKKKQEEKTEKARQKLGELSVDDTTSKREKSSSSAAFGKRQKLSESSAAGRMPLDTFPSEDSRSTSKQETGSTEGGPTGGRETAEADDKVEEAAKVAEPSAFAQTLFGSASGSRGRSPTELFALPYPASFPPLADAFSGPSPDDVVLAAQAKGSILRKSKH